jgi:hypothetical protein
MTPAELRELAAAEKRLKEWRRHHWRKLDLPEIAEGKPGEHRRPIEHPFSHPDPFSVPKRPGKPKQMGMPTDRRYSAYREGPWE